MRRDLFLMLWSNVACVLPIFTLVPCISRLVMDFDLTANRSETGYFAAPVIGVFYLGRMIGSPICGKASDSYGRRPVILFCLAWTIVTQLASAFSWTYSWLLGVRFLFGLTSPIMLVTKAAVNDLAEQIDSAYAIGVINLAWNIGNMLGSVNGGLLTHPEESLGLDVPFPYLLPFLLWALWVFVTLIGVYCWFPETLKVRGEINTTRPLVYSTTRTKLLFMNLTVSFAQAAWLILCTLWFWSHKSHGGLEMTQSEMGWVLFGSLAVFFVFAGLVYKLFFANFGIRWTFVVGNIVQAVVIVVTPFVSVVESRWGQFVLAGAAYLVLEIQIFIIISAYSIMLNNSVPPEHGGMINGMSLILNWIGALFNYLVTGAFFAWTAGLRGVILNYRLSFWIVGLILLATAWVGWTLPNSLELPYRRKAEKDSTYIELLNLN